MSHVELELTGVAARAEDLRASGTPVRRARSFVRARPVSSDGSGGGGYHGCRSPREAPLVGEGGAGATAGGASAVPSCGKPVRRARSFQRVLSPRRGRGSTGACPSAEPTEPRAGRPVRRAGHFQCQRAPSPVRRERSPRRGDDLQWRKRCANSSATASDDDDDAAPPAKGALPRREPHQAPLVMPLADHFDLLACVLSWAEGHVLRRVLQCSRQLNRLAADTLRCAAWRARMSSEADVEPRVAVCVMADKPALLQREVDALPPGARALIFCLAKRQCDAVCRALAGRPRCHSIHSDKRPAERALALEEFASGAAPLLVATGADALREHAALAARLIFYDFPRQMEEYARRTADLSRRGFSGIAVSFLTAHDLRPLTPPYASPLHTRDSERDDGGTRRDEVVRGMLALCVRGAAPTPLLLGKRDRLLAHRTLLLLLRERPICLGVERGGARFRTLCTSNLSLVPVERWERLPNAPWPPFRVYDLCTGAWLSFAYEDIFEVRLPAAGESLLTAPAPDKARAQPA